MTGSPTGFGMASTASRRTTIAANVRQGTLQDAQWESYSVNAGHGLKRSNADKERQVRNALRHPKAQGMSNVQIAKHVGVDDKTVRRYRTEMEAASEIPSLTSRQGADGKSYPALAPRLPRAPTPAELPTVRPLNDEETRNLVWRTIRAENEIAPGASSLFKWRKYLDWLGKHGEPRHYAGGIPRAAGVRIDAIALATTIAAVAEEISNNILPGPPVNEAQPVVETAAPSINLGPATLPADLIARGWELRRLAATNRWWCHNASIPCATSPYDTIAEAVEAARGMQVDTVKPTAKPAGDDEIHRALRQIEQAVTDLVNRLGVDTLRVRLDKQPTGDNWTLAVITKGDVASFSDSTLLPVATMLRNVGRKVRRANQT